MVTACWSACSTEARSFFALMSAFFSEVQLLVLVLLLLLLLVVPAAVLTADIMAAVTDVAWRRRLAGSQVLLCGGDQGVLRPGVGVELVLGVADRGVGRLLVEVELLLRRVQRVLRGVDRLLGLGDRELVLLPLDVGRARLRLGQRRQGVVELGLMRWPGWSAPTRGRWWRAPDRW